MKKLTIVIVFLAFAMQCKAQVGYSISSDTLNSDQYLRKIGYLERADIYRAMLISYKVRVGIEDSVRMLFTEKDFSNDLSGMYVVDNNGIYTIYVTLDCLKNDRDAFFIHGINLQLCWIGYQMSSQYSAAGENPDLGMLMLSCVFSSMGHDKYLEYLQITLNDSLKYKKQVEKIDSLFVPKYQDTFK